MEGVEFEDEESVVAVAVGGVFMRHVQQLLCVRGGEAFYGFPLQVPEFHPAV